MKPDDLPEGWISRAEIVAAMSSGIGEENINRDVEGWYTRGPILPMDVYVNSSEAEAKP